MDERDIRVSDTDRERVVATLHDAVGAGYITLAEFDERSTTTMHARTRGELDDIVADIPGTRQLSEPAVRKDPLRLKAMMSTIERKNRWEAPAHIHVHGRAGDITLDFTEAVLEHNAVDVEIDDWASDIRFLVPAEATADVDGLTAKWGEVQSKIPATPRGTPHLHIHGNASLTTLRIKVPRKARRRR